jgi:hypothetical protein
VPLCRACIHGKQHHHPTTTSPSLVPMYRGTPTTMKYHAGTLFVDHASHFLYFTPHFSTGTKEAIAAKHCFELLAPSHHHNINVIILIMVSSPLNFSDPVVHNKINELNSVV